jgi:hypothetical protein
LLLTLVLAESAIVWLAASLALVTPDRPDDRLPAWPVFAVAYAAALLPRLIEALDVWERGYAVWMSVGIVGSALLLVKTASVPEAGWLDPAWLRTAGDDLILQPSDARLPVWPLLGVVVYAWWRGRRRAEPTPDGAYLQFRIGTPLVLLGVVVHGVVDSPVPQRSIVGAVLVFFAASLLAIGAARLGGLGRAGGGTALGLGRWAGSLLLPILGVVAVGIVVAGAASRDLLDTAIWALAPLVWGISVVVRVLVLVVALIAFILVSPILWLLAGREFEVRRTDPAEDDGTFRDTLEREAERVMAIPEVLRYALALMLLSAILAALTRFVLHRRRRQVALPLEDRASVFSARELLGALAARLRSLLGARPHAEVDPLADLRRDRRWRHTVAIRETYARLLRRGAALGRPRPTGTTATEHVRHLTALPPARAVAGDLGTLTERYAAARYGREPATAEEAAAVREVWNRIEKALDS